MIGIGMEFTQKTIKTKIIKKKYKTKKKVKGPKISKKTKVSKAGKISKAKKVSSQMPNKRGPPPYSMLTPLPQYQDDTVFK